MKPLVLVTNDDGITSPGLRDLAAAAIEHGLPVVVAAPARESSGMSAALRARIEEGRVIVRPTVLPGLADVPAFAVAASPGYIAMLGALGAFGPPPSVVLSGINWGANLGRAILHSGTVGAALTAADTGARAMAVSLHVPWPPADDDKHHWGTAASLTRRLLPWLLDAPPGTVLNLNVPDVPLAELRGQRRATLDAIGHVQMTLVESGDGYLRTGIEAPGHPPVPGSDVALLAEGYATITPIRRLGHADEVRLPL